MILDRADTYEIYADRHDQMDGELDYAQLGDDMLSVRARHIKLLRCRAVSERNVNNWARRPRGKTRGKFKRPREKNKVYKINQGIPAESAATNV